IDFLKKNPRLAKFWDQDALNKVIDGDFVCLENKWNTLIDLYEGAGDVKLGNSEASIVHYVGSLKPWQLWCLRPQKEMYWTYLKNSPWAQASPELPLTRKSVLSSMKSIKKQLLD
ncbi:MAG: glycosyltransferase, partial [Cyanobacteria bacterium J06632_22]